MPSRGFLLGSTLVFLSLAGCQKSERPIEKPAPAPAASGYGVISGTVRLDPVPSPLPPLATNVSAERQCGATIPDRSLVVSAGGALEDAVVWIDAPATKSPPKVLPATTVDQRRCDYAPKVLAATAGANLSFLNSDELVHSIHAEERHRTLFTFAMPLTGMTVSRKLSATPGIVTLGCDLHPWMKAWVRVFDHPYFAVTDAEGRFRIEGVPAGSRRLHVWQPRLGEVERDVDVPAQGRARVDVRWSGATAQASSSSR